MTHPLIAIAQALCVKQTQIQMFNCCTGLLHGILVNRSSLKDITAGKEKEKPCAVK